MKKKLQPNLIDQLETDLKLTSIEEKKQDILSQRFKDRNDSKKIIVDKLVILKNILGDFIIESNPDNPLSESVQYKKLIESEKHRKIIEDKIMDLINKL